MFLKAFATRLHMYAINARHCHYMANRYKCTIGNIDISLPVPLVLCP